MVFSSSPLLAGVAQYAYDDLGRLTTVVDEAGNTAIYNYDAVGNLLSIDRYAPGGSGIGIYALLPGKGAIGSQVKIQGYGFSATPTDNTVTFNSTAATVVSSTTYSIIATVPSGATTGTVVVGIGFKRLFQPCSFFLTSFQSLARKAFFGTSSSREDAGMMTTAIR